MKTKLYNVIFPVWLIIFLPPVILLVIPGNFLIDFIMLLIILKILKNENIKEIIKKNYLKVVGFGFLADVIGGAILLLSIFIEPLNDLSWNPYKSIFATIYLIIAFAISTYLIYFFNKKFNFKNTENKNKIALLLAILTAPYLFLVPTSAFYYNPLNITNYDDTSIESTAKMNQIFKYIENDPYKIEETKIDKEKKEVTLNIVNSDEYYNYYITIEEYASLLFALTNDLNKVIIEVNDINYEFEYNHINDIYNKRIRDIDISKIYNREAEIYSDTSIYMGNIDGKYDLFDESENCSTDIVPLYEDEYNKYSISCNDIEKLFVKDNNKKINIKEALNNKLFNVSDLSTTTIRIYKEAK